ncbi:bifunctional DNA primase/polymerase [Mycolicibacterium sp.]|uniref:bifunctional DNA primase/polymerase n=1 Tax=Mycolicibacterium sp. TaxID=2320850 RepID=UPI0037CB724F
MTHEQDPARVSHDTPTPSLFDQFLAARPQLVLDPDNRPVPGWCRCPRYLIGDKPIIHRHAAGCDATSESGEAFTYVGEDRLMHGTTVDALAAWIPVPPTSPAQNPAVNAVVIARMIELGFHLVRLHPGTKHPIGLRWNDPAVTPALTADEAIAHVESGGGLGVLLGPSMLIVIDAENAAAVAALATLGLRPVLYTAKGRCPVTCDPRADKRGGGHYWFRYGADFDRSRLRNLGQRKIGDGGVVDVLATPGSMAVVPPTALVEAGGWNYSADGSNPIWPGGQAELDDLPAPPEWLLDASVECPAGFKEIHGGLGPKLAQERGPRDEHSQELTDQIDDVPWDAITALDDRLEDWGDSDPDCGCDVRHWRGAEKRKSATLHDCSRGKFVHIWSLTMMADLRLGDKSSLSPISLACVLLGKEDRGSDFREVAKMFKIALGERTPLGTVTPESYDNLARIFEQKGETKRAASYRDAAAGMRRAAAVSAPAPGASGETFINEPFVGSVGPQTVGANALKADTAVHADTAAEPDNVVPLRPGVVPPDFTNCTTTTVGSTPEEPEQTPEEKAAAEAEAAAEALADKRDPYRHLPDPCSAELEEAVFGDSRLPQVGRIRDVARAAAMSPWSTLGLSIGRGLLRVEPSVMVPDLVGGLPAPLNFQIGVVGASGRGKGAAHGLVDYDAGRMIPNYESYDKKFMPPSGAALAGLFVERQKDDDGNVEVVQIRKAAWCDWSEVDTLTAQSGRGGNDLAPELRAAITGAELGTDPKKDGADPLKVDALSYRILVSFSTQYGKPAVSLMAERDGGTLQRTNWFSTTDPRSLTKRPRGPKPRAQIDIMRSLPVDHVEKHPDGDREILTVDDDIWDEVWEAQANKIRFDRDVDELAGHQNLNRLRTAAWAALIQHKAHIGAFEWEWAGHVMEHSRRVRDRLEASVKGVAKAQAVENGSLDFDRKNAAELAKAAHFEKLVTSLAKWARDCREGRNAFGKTNGGRFTVRDIRASAKDAKAERYTRADELAAELLQRKLWDADATHYWSVEPDPE